MDPKYKFTAEALPVGNGIADRVDEAVQNVGSLVSRLEQLADRLCGSTPESDSPGRLQAVQDGVFERIASQSTAINQYTGRGHEIINRIMDRL